MIFTFLKGWNTNQAKEEEYFMTWKLNEIHISVSVNKVLWEHSRACVHVVYGCFHTLPAKSSSCNRDFYDLQSLKNIYYMAF